MDAWMEKVADFYSHCTMLVIIGSGVAAFGLLGFCYTRSKEWLLTVAVSIGYAITPFFGR